MAQRSRRDVFSQIGGHRALDLVNTVQWRLSEAKSFDDIRDYADVVRWARQVGAITSEASEKAEAQASLTRSDADAEVARVRELREALYATLFEDADPEPVVAEYEQALSAGRLARTNHGGDAWTWELPVDVALPRRAIALDAFDLLTRADLSLLAQCQDAECGWVFLDSSPRHNRRWCVAADCGNRNRARDFYRRSRAGASE
jgi:predicted RNA-binding Zn ribbon-like protein